MDSKHWNNNNFSPTIYLLTIYYINRIMKKLRKSSLYLTFCFKFMLLRRLQENYINLCSIASACVAHTLFAYCSNWNIITYHCKYFLPPVCGIQILDPLHVKRYGNNTLQLHTVLSQ